MLGQPLALSIYLSIDLSCVAGLTVLPLVRTPESIP